MSRKVLNRAVLLMGMVMTSVGIWAPVAGAQATIGAGDGKNTMSVDFYKVPPGEQDE